MSIELKKRLSVILSILAFALIVATVTYLVYLRYLTEKKGQQTAGVVYNVVNYGADPNGIKDSTNAIRTAIVTAELKPGSEVYFPKGTYILNKLSNKLFDFVITRPIKIIGAGINNTTIINEVGQKKHGVKLSTDIFAIEVNNNTLSGGGSGTEISDMTLNSLKYDAGTAIMDFADNTVLSNLLVFAPFSTNTYNSNAFGLRVIAICNPNNYKTIYRTNNLVDNVTIVGQGTTGTTELDLSCQLGSKVLNVRIDGNGMDIFMCRNIYVNHAILTGGSGGNINFYTWVITGSTDVHLKNILVNGSAGVVAPDVKVVSKNIYVSHEKQTNKLGSLQIGDSVNLFISSSSLAKIYLDPKKSIYGVKLSDTTYSSVTCNKHIIIKNLKGIRCSTS